MTEKELAMEEKINLREDCLIAFSENISIMPASANKRKFFNINEV